MRENYFTKLIKYINNVYHIDKQIEHISDKRVNPKFKTPQIISIVLTGFILRIKSFNQLNLMIKAEEFNNINRIVGSVPRIDAIRNSLKSIDLNSLRKVIQSIIKKAIRNKFLDKGTIDGYKVATIDGTNLFNSQKPHYNDYILKKSRGKEYYSHSCAVMSLIGDQPSLIRFCCKKSINLY